MLPVTSSVKVIFKALWIAMFLTSTSMDVQKISLNGGESRQVEGYEPSLATEAPSVRWEPQWLNGLSDELVLKLNLY
jgi:hypothetical protein